MKAKNDIHPDSPSSREACLPARGIVPRPRSGFTLIEMLVVLAIIILIASLLIPAVQDALAKAKERKCMAQMRSMGQVWFANYSNIAGAAGNYETDRIYPWLSAMHPDPLGSPVTYVCPADRSGGRDGSKPDDPDFQVIDPNDFPGTDDNENNPAAGQHARRNPEITRNSYMYEFNDATCDWWNGYVLGPGGNFATSDQIDLNGDGRITWGEVKVYQLRHGDSASQGAYDPNQFPVIRCFHHFRARPVLVRDLESNQNVSQIRVLNAAVTGRVFISGAQWEYPLAN